MAEEEHYLDEYLSTRLEELGLDSITYGPYLKCLFPCPSLKNVTNNSDQNEVFEEINEEELDGCIELLQSSSESHCDDDVVWVDLKQTVLSLRESFLEKFSAQKSIENQNLQKQKEEKLQNERIEAQKYSDLQQKQKDEKPQKSEEELERVRLLVERFGYEEPPDEDNENENNNNDQTGDKVPSTSNATGTNSGKNGPRQGDGGQTQTKIKEQEKKAVQTKQGARQITKSHKEDKLKRKEERKKRAQKGERRR